MNNQIQRNADIIVGIDIGTTTISAIAYNPKVKITEETYTILNDSNIQTDKCFKEQDAEKIISKVLEIAHIFKQKYSKILSIGLTGQMHGILYVDQNGIATSPLYTWQDGRGDLPLNGTSYCDNIKAITNEEICSGYGFSTHYYNLTNNIVPKTAITFCSIMDYAVMRLCNLKKPLIHATNAASFGLFDIKNNKFKTESLNKLGIDTQFLPDITSSDAVAGYFEGIPVSVAIGDNQASVFSTIKNESESIVVNYGTGSQVSAVTVIYTETDDFEIRPYINGKYLLNYSALCGGKAYAILEKFFKNMAIALGLEENSHYELMNTLAEKALETKDLPTVNTLFCGTRKNPSLKGSITNIGEFNFTPENLTLGFLQGMVTELYENYCTMKLEGINQVVASGNAVKKNSVLQAIIKKTFAMETFITENNEEAALGSALFGALACKIADEKTLKDCITLKAIE